MTGEVITIDPDAGVPEAQDKMSKHHIRHLPVVDSSSRVIGIVTDRDVRSAMPHNSRNKSQSSLEEDRRLSGLKVRDIMTEDPITISPLSTIQDAMLIIQKERIGALPVVDEKGMLKGIISTRDLLRAFINVMGIGQPGSLLGILVDDEPGQLKKIVDVIAEERISTGSVLVARHWKKGKRAIFPFLLAQHVNPVKDKLRSLGFEIIDPLDWHIDQLQEIDGEH